MSNTHNNIRKNHKAQYAGFMRLFGFVWMMLLCGLAGYVAYAYTQHQKTLKRYEQTTGRIVTSNIDEHVGRSGSSDSRKHFYTPVIEYTYVVDGKQYNNKDYANRSISFGTESTARRIVEKYPQGTQTNVYYLPSSPGIAFLVSRFPPQLLGMAFILKYLLVLTLASICVWLCKPARAGILARFLAEPMRLPWRIPTWGTMKENAGGVLTIEQRGNTLNAFFAGYGISCILITLLGMFALLFIDDNFSRLTPTLLIVASCVAVTIAILAALATRAKRLRTLEIDTTLGIIQLRTKTQNEEIRISDITKWIVKQVLSRRPGTTQGFKTVMAPIVFAETRDNKEIRIHQFNDDDEGIQLSHRVGKEFASLTDKPVEFLDPQS